MRVKTEPLPDDAEINSNNENSNESKPNDVEQPDKTREN